MGGNFIGATGLDENQEQFDILQENIDANASYINNLVGIPDPVHLSLFGINPLNPGLYGLVERAEVNIAALQSGEEGLGTDLSALTTQVEGIETQITGIQGEISTIQGEITAVEGSVSTIQGEIAIMGLAITAAAGVAGDALGKANKSLGIWDEDGNNTYNMKSGNVGIGILPKGTLLNNKLEVNGSINIPTNSKYKINNVPLSYSDLAGTPPVSSKWTNAIDVATNIYYSTGNVGIGITSAINNKLEVGGSINIPTGSKYKINNVDLSYNDLTNKLTGGTNISIVSGAINNTLTAGTNISIVSGAINNTLTAGTNISIVSGAINNTLTAGTNISIVSGAINNTYTYTLPTAGIGSGGTLGGVKVDNSTITITNGVISAAAGTPQVNSDWTQTNDNLKSFIQNKPTAGNNISFANNTITNTITGSTSQNIIGLNANQLIIVDKPNSEKIDEVFVPLTNEPYISSPAFTESIRTFTHSGGTEAQTPYTITIGQNTICDILIVGGGGAGGGRQGGGGGGGGVMFLQNLTLSSGNYTIKVGKGGTTTGDMVANGVDSEFSSYIAYGGSGGGGYSIARPDFNITTNRFASGGGAMGWNNNSGYDGYHNANERINQTNPSVQGGSAYKGGRGWQDVSGEPSSFISALVGGGGGGAGGLGQDATPNNNINYTGKAGDGGVGLNYSSVFGTSVGHNGWFGGGGGGAGYSPSTDITGTGGTGGGGNGNSGGVGVAGTNGTGGGGGGGGFANQLGGFGGNGIVIIKLKTIVGAAISEGNPITHKTLNFTYDLTKYTEYQAQLKTGVGGWRIVRFLPPNLNRWYQGDYISTSTFSIPTIGTPYNYTNEWAVSFGTFDEMFFGTFDMTYWLQCLKTSVLGSYGGVARPIIKSSSSSTPYSAIWYNRGGNTEDPWVSIADHPSLVVYGENNTNVNMSLLNAYGGMCVLVRDSTASTTIPNPNQYTLSVPLSGTGVIINNTTLQYLSAGNYTISVGATQSSVVIAGIGQVGSDPYPATNGSTIAFKYSMTQKTQASVFYKKDGLIKYVPASGTNPTTGTWQMFDVDSQALTQFAGNLPLTRIEGNISGKIPISSTDGNLPASRLDPIDMSKVSTGILSISRTDGNLPASRLDAIDMSKVSTGNLNYTRISGTESLVNERFHRIIYAYENVVDTMGVWTNKFKVNTNLHLNYYNQAYNYFQYYLSLSPNNVVDRHKYWFGVVKMSILVGTDSSSITSSYFIDTSANSSFLIKPTTSTDGVWWLNIWILTSAYCESMLCTLH